VKILDQSITVATRAVVPPRRALRSFPAAGPGNRASDGPGWRGRGPGARTPGKNRRTTARPAP